MNETEWHPGTLLKISGSYWQTCALHAGVKLDLFTTLGEDRNRSKDLAAKLKVDKRALLSNNKKNDNRANVTINQAKL